MHGSPDYWNHLHNIGTYHNHRLPVHTSYSSIGGMSFLYLEICLSIKNDIIRI